MFGGRDALASHEIEGHCGSQEFSTQALSNCESQAARVNSEEGVPNGHARHLPASEQVKSATKLKVKTQHL